MTFYTNTNTDIGNKIKLNTVNNSDKININSNNDIKYCFIQLRKSVEHKI